MSSGENPSQKGEIPNASLAIPEASSGVQSIVVLKPAPNIGIITGKMRFSQNTNQ